MPFTGSHPAAVLPFLGSAMPASALVIGSMSPDLPLFVRLPYSVAFSHEIVGAATVDLAVGLVLYLLWLLVLRPFVVECLPPGLAGRVRPAGRPGPHCVLAGLAVGALTHVVWDSFTHADGWAVRHLPALQQRLGPLGAHEWAQHASSALGALVLTMWLVRRRRADPPSAEPPVAQLEFPARRTVYRVVGGLALIGGVLGWWYGLHQPDPIRSAFFHSATKSIDAGGIAVLVFALIRLVRTARPDQNRG